MAAPLFEVVSQHHQPPGQCQELICALSEMSLPPGQLFFERSRRWPPPHFGAGGRGDVAERLGEKRSSHAQPGGLGPKCSGGHLRPG